MIISLLELNYNHIITNMNEFTVSTATTYKLSIKQTSRQAGPADTGRQAIIK